MKRAADRARRSLGKFGGEIRPLSQSSIPALKCVCVRVRVCHTEDILYTDFWEDGRRNVSRQRAGMWQCSQTTGGAPFAPQEYPLSFVFNTQVLRGTVVRADCRKKQSRKTEEKKKRGNSNDILCK